MEVYKCDRCLRIFDKTKIIQNTYGVRHCNKCMNQLRHHEIQQRAAQWNPPIENVPVYMI